MKNRLNISSGTKWEELVGYSRSVKIGNVIEISGTAPVQDGKTLYPGNAYEQAKACIKIIEKSLLPAGATLNDVIRTRMFVTDISRWEEYGRAHKEFFEITKPATSMVEVRSLISPDMLIEIEATAIISERES
jgi:enamine deaminase RidA (YjgF/YER057c/UK114 family)